MARKHMSCALVKQLRQLSVLPDTEIDHLLTNMAELNSELNFPGE